MQDGAISACAVLMLGVWRKCGSLAGAQVFACQRAVNKAQTGGWLRRQSCTRHSDAGD